MKYILNGDEFTAIEETLGTVVNISNVPAEITSTEEHNTGIILYPQQQFWFDREIFAARKLGYSGNAVLGVIGVPELSGGGGSGTTVITIGGGEIETVTPSDIDVMFGSDTNTGTTTTDTTTETITTDTTTTETIITDTTTTETVITDTTVVEFECDCYFDPITRTVVHGENCTCCADNDTGTGGSSHTTVTVTTGGGDDNETVTHDDIDCLFEI